MDAPTCRYCASPMEPVSDRTDTLPAHRHWWQCRSLECRAQSPRMLKPAAAALAALQPSP